jgi:hypothetical protein
MKQSYKTAGAVILGLLTIVILSNGTDTVLELTGVYPSLATQQGSGFHNPWMLTLALSYRLIAAIIGGYVTARLAPTRRAILILAAIGLAGGTAGIIVGATTDISPMWYPVAIAVLSLPAVYFGASLYRPRKTEARPEPA